MPPFRLLCCPDAVCDFIPRVGEKRGVVRMGRLPDRWDAFHHDDLLLILCRTIMETVCTWAFSLWGFS